MQYCGYPYWSQRLTQHHGWPDAAFIQYFQKVQNKLFTQPNMQRHRCRKDKESISWAFSPPGATTLQCLQNIGQRWVAKYVSVSAQNWRESGSVGLHGAVSCLQFRPHKVCNRHTAHFCAVQTCVACKLQPWVRCLGPTPARPQCR